MRTSAMNVPTILSMKVRSEWIDFNNHMGDFAYTIVFSDALEPLLDIIGLDEVYRSKSNCTIFTLESHVSFLREIHLDDEISIGFQIIDFDSKRVHAILSMRNGNGDVCAYFEVMLMHMRAQPSGKRRPEPFPENALRLLEKLAMDHRSLPLPEKVGASIGIPHRRP